MSRRRAVGLCVLLAALLGAFGSNAYAQGGTTQTLSGTVVDTSGAVIPGADVVAKHTATGVTSTAVSNAEGIFSIPSLSIGAYAVTVTIQGFKTVVVNNVVLTSGAGASVKAMMEVGGLTEQVTVSSASEIVQTQASGVSTTVNTNQITKLPIISRSAMDFVNLLPGVATPNGNRNATVNGLSRSAINITLDGVNIQDNTNKGSSGNDGFFAMVSPRLDAIEEVTVSSAGQGADATGNGAIQIKFVTRSGTNTFSGSGYEYFRSDKFNANTWFNNRNGVAKAKLKQNQTGIRAGGPIVVPGFVDGHDKAFFFFNYEELRQPSDTTRNRTLLNPAAQNGTFCYTGNCVNVLQVAAGAGQLATVDPTIGKLLTDIRQSTTTTGSVSTQDVNLDTFRYNVPVESMRRFPTARVDYNVSNAHRLSSSWNYNWFTDTPDTLNNHEAFWPGFPNEAGQGSTRWSWGNALRSTLGRNLVSEASAAYSSAPITFYAQLDPSMWKGSLANQNGFQINFPTIGSALTSAGAAPNPQSRNSTTLDIKETLTWLKGQHSFTFGGAWSNYGIWLKNSNLLPRITTGMIATDPALAMFNATNFPGASTANLTAAQNLYAFLTGRVTAITGDARIDDSGQYVANGTGIQRGSMTEYGTFIQDQWRLRQNVTANLGLRWDVQNPFTAANSSYTFGDLANICGVSGVKGDSACNVFQPGVQPGVANPVYQQYQEGVKSYNTDFNNLAPSAGVAWTPQARPGFLGTLMGSGDFVVRAGYARAFTRPALGDLTGIFNNNPGITITTTRNEGLGNLTTAGVPLLFRSGNLDSAPFNPTPVYPIPTNVSQSIAGFDPNIQMAYSDSFQAGITRSLGKTMAIEVRYVGTRGHGDWNDYNYNEFNISENGFLNEFRQAQKNLAANIAAGPGRGCIGGVTTANCQNNFAFTGAPGTAALPIFLAYFNRVASAGANTAANYSGANWTNATFLGFLSALNPNPYGFAQNNTTNGLQGNATFRANALAAGLPANFFIANPAVTSGFVRTNLDDTYYNSLQLELRRRLSQGLQFQTSYVYGAGYQSTFFSFRKPELWRRDSGDPGDLTHQIKGNVVYDLPFGRGRRFAGDAGGLVERLVGGWQIGVTANINSGRLVNLGNVRLVGMSKNDVQQMFKLRFDDAGQQVYMLPQDVIDNTIRAFATSATSASGYAGAAPTGRYFAPAAGPDCVEVSNSTTGGAGTFGDCGTGDLVVSGPMFQQYDLRFSKRTAIAGSANFEFAAEMLNAFNHPNFQPVGGIGGTNTIANYQVTALQGTSQARIVQLVFRVNW